MTEAKAVTEPKAAPVDEASAQLDALERKAGTLDTTPEQEAEQQKATDKTEQAIIDGQTVAMVVAEFGAEVANTLWPVLDYDEKTKKRAVENLSPLFAKYMEKWGIQLGKRDTWGPEITAAAFVIPLAYVGYKTVQADNIEKAKEVARAKARQQEGVTVGSQ